jgi:hypothetical protein
MVLFARPFFSPLPLLTLDAFTALSAPAHGYHIEQDKHHQYASKTKVCS